MTMSMHVLYNARIVTETKTIPNGFLVIDGDKIAHVQEGPVTDSYLACEKTDCEGMILAPGFIDLHLHEDPVQSQKHLHTSLHLR